MTLIAKARAALTDAIASQDPKKIKAARAALLAAESAGDPPFKKGKKAEDHEEPDGDEEPMAAEPMEKEDDANPAESEGEADAEAEDAEAEDAEMEEGEAEEGEYAEPEEAEEAESKKMKKAGDSKKMKKAAANGSIGRLLAALGASNVAEAAGKAQALVEAAAALDKAKKQAKRAEKTAAMAKAFDDAQRAGRVTKAEIEHLRTVYASRPIGELRAYLSAKPVVASSQFARETPAHYPSEPVAGVNLSSPFATKAMQAFGVSPDAIAERAAARGIATSFPGAAPR